MPSEFREYLPHRRQRPLGDNSFAFEVLDKSTSPESMTTKLRTSYKVMAATVGLVTGLATIGMGATVLPWSVSDSAPQVAGAQTTEEYIAPPIEQSDDASSEAVTCWNKVELIDKAFYWSDVCRGVPQSDCAPTKVNLTLSEERAYRLWFVTNQDLPSACNDIPTEIPDRLPTISPF